MDKTIVTECNMSKRNHSSPELNPDDDGPESSSNLDGVATNVKVLLKLTQDQNEASGKNYDDRRRERVAGMMTILEDVKGRIQKSQANTTKKPELRRCNTELKRSPREGRKSPDLMTDDAGELRKHLNSSLIARKSLEIMCSSLGKEKEIMASELARKTHELNELEELINDLKVQNESLSAKVRTYAANQKEKKSGGDREAQDHNNAVALQDRNKALSEQLLKSLDGYRSLKRRYKEAKEETVALQKTMEDLRADVSAGLCQIRRFKSMAAAKEKSAMVIEEISKIEQMFECLEMKASKHHEQKKWEATAEIMPAKSPVVA